MLQRLNRTLAKDWPRFFLELVIVVSGVSISFAFQDWRESLRARAEEQRILRTIQNDLQMDLQTLDRYANLLTQGRDLLTGLLTRDGLKGKEMDVAMDQAITYVSFTPITVGWSELEQTGGARLIRNKDLLRKLKELHGQRYAACAEWNEINRDFVLKRMIPYLDDHGPYVDGAFEGGIAGGMGAIHKALFDEVRFRNLIRTNRLFREGQIAIFGAAAQKLKDVTVILELELNPPQ